MSNISKYNQNSKATVCSANQCVTVFGGTARIVNGIVVAVTAIVALAVLVKALR